jgi:hypothetical protein
MLHHSWRTKRTQIGVLRWAIEIGRIDILLQVSLLSSYTAQPKYVHKRSRIVFNEELPILVKPSSRRHTGATSMGTFKRRYRLERPKLGATHFMYDISVSCFVYVVHAGNQITRRSHQATSNSRDLYIWFRLCCYAYRSRDYRRTTIQITYDGDSH